MRWIAVLLIGALSNLDNLGVGVAFGIRGTRIGVVANLIIAATTMAATAAAVTGGDVLSKLLPSRVTGSLGPAIIISIGIGTVLISARTPRPPDSAHTAGGTRRHPREVECVISWREAMVLGVALSVNNLGVGIGAGVVGMPALATAASAGLFSLACVGAGSHSGWIVGRVVLGRQASLIAGMLLLAVGAAMLPGVR